MIKKYMDNRSFVLLNLKLRSVLSELAKLKLEETIRKMKEGIK